MAIFLLPVKNLTLPLCSSTTISYKTRKFRRFANPKSALHALHATRSSHEKAVCLSVCRTRDLWQNERKLYPFSYTTWKIIH